MIIERTSHFYAAHRNQHLRGDKCFGLHGHTYYVTVGFQVGNEQDSGVTILFSELESYLDAVLKPLDHAILWDANDVNLRDAINFLQTQDQQQHKMYELNEATSAEHLAKHIWQKINQKTPVAWVKLAETQTCTVVYKGPSDEV